MEEPEPKLDEELNSRHLLGLVFELNGVKESAAARKLEVPAEKISRWTSELDKQGLMRVTERETGDPLLRITPEGLKKLEKLEKEFAREEEGEEENPRPDPRKALKKTAGRIKAFLVRAAALIKELFRDIILATSTLLSLYLLKVFFDNPTVEVLSFFFGSLLLSLVLVLYHQYKKYLKTREVIGFMQWVERLAESQRVYIALTIVTLLLIYLAGMFVLNPQYRGVYLMLAVLFASLAALVYYPKKTTGEAVRFIAGMALLVYGLLLIVGWMSVTSFFGNNVRLIDAGFGAALLILVHVNEGFFGIRVKQLKRMAKSI